MPRLPAGTQNIFILMPDLLNWFQPLKPAQVFPISQPTFLGTPRFPRRRRDCCHISFRHIRPILRQWPPRLQCQDLYGGIHYRKDCEGGLALGNDVGEHIVENFAKTDGAD